MNTVAQVQNTIDEVESKIADVSQQIKDKQHEIDSFEYSCTDDVLYIQIDIVYHLNV